MITSARAAIVGVPLAMLLLSASGSAVASDCRNVVFKFKNNIPAKIRVLAVRIDGNKGSWREDIGNKVIVPTYWHTTNGRRMNKLDSGARPKRMSVEFEEHIPQTAYGWRNRTYRDFTALPTCVDGITYEFQMNPAP